MSCPAPDLKSNLYSMVEFIGHSPCVCLPFRFSDYSSQTSKSMRVCILAGSSDMLVVRYIHKHQLHEESVVTELPGSLQRMFKP